MLLEQLKKKSYKFQNTTCRTNYTKNKLVKLIGDASKNQFGRLTNIQINTNWPRLLI